MNSYDHDNAILIGSIGFALTVCFCLDCSTARIVFDQILFGIPLMVQVARSVRFLPNLRSVLFLCCFLSRNLGALLFDDWDAKEEHLLSTNNDL